MNKKMSSVGLVGKQSERMETENDTQQELNKIVRNRDEKGNILTYSVFTKLSNGMICEFEKNNRKELKCFEEVVE